MSSAVAGGVPETVGLPYEDASGTVYLPMFRQPVLVYTADNAALAWTHERAVGHGLRVAVYTEDLFKTDHDEDNRAAVRAVATQDLRLVGLTVFGPRNPVDARRGEETASERGSVDRERSSTGAQRRRPGRCP
ncbi:DUF2000 domain-containing protein [Nonomuraea sp. NPDC046570]|uniref:DUF2000 domain-containing protein n=1 Tax=Nonomuraea sp. NPDC046570 TaxID=3155255 RepID=UPI0033DAC0AE